MKILYPGSFNLFHAGHYCVYKKACDMFGKENVFLCVAKNPNKDLDLDFIAWTLRAITDNVIIAKDLIAMEKPDIIVRGLRDASDLNEELTMADWNMELGADTVFIPCTGNLRHISSSALRKLLNHDVSIDKYIPKEVRLSFFRWKNREKPNRYLYCGKIATGKSTFLHQFPTARAGFVGDCDTLFWNDFPEEIKQSIKDDIYKTIMAGDEKRYSELIRDLAICRRINWYKILSDKFLSYESSSIGQWFEYIPPEVLGKFQIVELTVSDEERTKRIAERGLPVETVEKFDQFYKTPRVVDKRKDISFC